MAEINIVSHYKRRCVMMKRRFLIILFAAISFAFAPFSNSYAKKVIELTYANFFPPTHVQGKLGKAWCDEVYKRTNGAVKITYFPGGTLLKGPQIYDGVLKGIADVGMSCFAYTRGRFPVMEAIDLPIGYPSGTVATRIINDYYKRFKPKELNNIQVMYLHAHGPGILHSKKAVYKLEDLKGLKIRCTGFSAKLAKALGAVPVAMGQGQAYEALSKGVVDATFSPMEVLKGWRQAEVVKYTVLCYSVAYTTGMYVVMNKSRWNSLPKDIRATIVEINKEWIPKHGKAWDTSDAEGKKYALSLGNKIIELSAAEQARWAKAARPVINGYISEMKKKGYPADQYVAYIESLLKKYSK